MWPGAWFGGWLGDWYGASAYDEIRVHWLEVEPSADQVQVFWLEVEPDTNTEQPAQPSDASGHIRTRDRRRKKREERIARELLARQQHAEASAIGRAVGDSALVALHRPQEQQLAQQAQAIAQAIAQEAIDKARAAAVRERDQRLRLLACAALVMTN